MLKHSRCICFFEASFLLFLLVLFSFNGCEIENNEVRQHHECFQLQKGSHLPRLNKSQNQLLLSYVNSSHSKIDTLAIYAFEDDQWIGPNLETYGENWFINWADFPSVVPVDSFMKSSYYFYHWLQYSGEGTYDYDIIGYIQYPMALTFPGKLHLDSITAEHGFLSSAALPDGTLQVSWLDGRFTKQDLGAAAGADKVEKQADHHGHGDGAMTLRTANLPFGNGETELDHRVCDCCNTATVATDSLVMVAYRDRSEHEIRDIAYVINASKPVENSEWSTPKLVHADNWEINGCPVNGPALAANAKGDIAIVWYTAANEDARLQFARYDVANDRFSAPTLLDDDDPLGRVDIQLAEDGTAFVTGLAATENPDSAALTLWTVDLRGNVAREQLTITSAARSSGFPKIALFEDKLYWARTVVGAEKGEQFVEVCWR